MTEPTTSGPYLSVVAIVKNEGPYLEEWLAFHRLVGVEHFWMYDNLSEDETGAILDEAEDVTRIIWSGHSGQQFTAYKDALERCESTWLAFIDADEYLYSPTLRPVSSVLRAFETHAAVGVGWLVFGSSGLRTRRPSTLKAYTQRAELGAWENTHVKSIVQPARLRSHAMSDPHHFDGETVNEKGEVFEGPFNPNPSWDLLAINHYWVRSEEEKKAKMRRLRADTPQKRNYSDVNDNAVVDTTIQAYLPMLEATRVPALHHFYHVFADGHWRTPVQEHVQALAESGFDRPITVGMVGTRGNRNGARAVIDDLCYVENWVEADVGWEQVTLQLLADYAAEAQGAVLYAHTKGAANPAPIQDAWRRSMMVHTIKGWKYCLQAIGSGYEAVGCHWLTKKEFPGTVEIPFFGGNYWMATCRYVRRLPPLPMEDRHGAERWIGMADEPPHVLDLFPGWPGTRPFTP